LAARSRRPSEPIVRPGWTCRSGSTHRWLRQDGPICTQSAHDAMTWKKIFAVVTVAALIGMVMGGLFGFVGGRIAPEFFVTSFPGRMSNRSAWRHSLAQRRASSSAAAWVASGSWLRRCSSGSGTAEPHFHGCGTISERAINGHALGNTSCRRSRLRPRRLRFSDRPERHRARRHRGARSCSAGLRG
jgi:hypothetical protein